MTAADSLEGRASELQRQFDLSFSAAPMGEPPASEDLLAIRVAGDRYAIRLREISGIVSDRPIVPLPSARSEVLGLAGIRGGLLPVFSLSSLLGYSPDSNASRWMVLCGDAEPIALAFAEFDGFLRLPASEVYSDRTVSVGSSAEVTREIVHTDAGPRTVISIAAVVSIVRRQLGSTRPVPE